MKKLMIGAIIAIPIIAIITFRSIEINKENNVESNEKDMYYENEMKKFVSEIHDHADNVKKDFIVVQQNAEDLIFDSDGNIDKEYIKHIDGIGREDIFYGYEGVNVKTEENVTNSISEKLDLYKENNKKVFTIDYCNEEEKIVDAYESSSAKGYVSVVEELELNNIMENSKEITIYNDNDIKTLDEVSNFLYLINPEKYGTKEELVEDLCETNHDLLVVDLFLYDEIMLNKNDLQKLKIKANGGERLVLCYLSIGEAEDYRYYFDKYNLSNETSFLLEENDMWEGNFKVEYWNEQWKKIIYSDEDSYLNRILESDFDGVYLDLVDAYQYFNER